MQKTRPKGKFLGKTHLCRASCSVGISVSAMAQMGQIMVPRTNKNVLLYRRHGQSCRGFCTLETHPASLEKIWFWEGIPAAGRRMLQGHREGRKGSYFPSLTWDSVLTVTRRAGHDGNIQRGKSILEKHPKPSPRALGSWGQPVCHSTGNVGAAAALTSRELGCSVLLLSDLFHQLQVVVTGFLVVHHGQGVILTWAT